MASIIEGYSYDIFISYRQKDNKYDGWVTEFVENLKKELEATIKDDISVYFDINPHDGLLETHEVAASLEEKLKCLIFIPVISQTYCDPKSFAWKYEFCAFNKLANEDQIGRNIRLAGGNVTSRILPVKIHDLDPEDKLLLENELGGVLRGIEFIYKSAGVNRPLRANEDHPHDNLNKTYYRDQINKVANAVKEIIKALSKPQQLVHEDFKEELKRKLPPKRNLKPKILGGASLLLLLLIIGYFFIQNLIASKNEVEKSIAVLPFINDSPDQENGYFINGLMDEILNNLQKIKEFRVLSRTSTEQYRGINRPAIPKIAKALDVNYIVEGSGQKYGNTFRLRVQLIAANNEKHLWGESFEQEIKETKDIFRIQSLIAQSIAVELKATITPEENQLIEKTPTANLTAYDFYQRGKEELDKSPYPSYNRESVQRAEELFNKALEYDSTFAMAYAGLAFAMWKKYDTDITISDASLKNKLADSTLMLANIALSFDEHLSEAYVVKGGYYAVKGNTEKALQEWNKAAKYNPNDWLPYFAIAGLNEELNILESIKNLQKAASLNHGPQIIQILKSIGWNLYAAGFPEEGKDYLLDALKLDGDSVSYSNDIVELDALNDGNYKKVIEYYEYRHMKDTTDTGVLNALGNYYVFDGQFKESLKYFKKYLLAQNVSGQNNLPINHYIGYSYLQNGYRKEAEACFARNIQAADSRLKLLRPGERIYSVYPLACIYAATGDKAKAYENLKIFNQNPSFALGWVTDLKTNPMLNSLRNEPEFQNISRDVETKYQKQHENVKKWLEEQGKL